MKMIDVMIKLANGWIEDQTTLKIYDHHVSHTYTFERKYNSFYSNTKYRRELGGHFKTSGDFLNYEVELIPPKEKKYLIKVNVQGLHEDFSYLNYFEEKNQITIYEKDTYEIYKIHFTKSEMQSIKPVREFLEDMEGKYELIEVNSNDSMDSIKCNSTNIATNEEHTFTF